MGCVRFAARFLVIEPGKSNHLLNLKALAPTCADKLIDGYIAVLASPVLHLKK